MMKYCFYFSASSDHTYPNFIEKFAGDTFSNCGAALGKNKPKNGRGSYWLDNDFPVYHIETGKQESSE